MTTYPFAHNIRAMNTIRHIRKDVFRKNQAEFAALIGVKQSTVSRWENGTEPDRADLAAIRAAAVRMNVPWSDDWFFEAPAEQAP